EIVGDEGKWRWAGIQGNRVEKRERDVARRIHKLPIDTPEPIRTRTEGPRVVGGVWNPCAKAAIVSIAEAHGGDNAAVVGDAELQYHVGGAGIRIAIIDQHGTVRRRGVRQDISGRSAARGWAG